MAVLPRKSEAPGCPRCWTPVPAAVLAAGSVYCGDCGLAFEAAVFSPPERAAPKAVVLEEGQSRCARHGRNAAIAACDRCGAFMCGLCKVEVDGKAICTACFERLRTHGELESVASTFRSWRTLGAHLAILGLPMISLGALIGPASMISTARGMSQDKRDGSEGGTAGAIAALVLAALETVVGLAIIATMVFALTRKK